MPEASSSLTNPSEELCFSYPDRTFQFWDFSPGHSRMLIRSFNDKDQLTTIDIVLIGVVHINLPNLMRGLTVTLGSPADWPLVAETIQHLHPNEKFLVFTTGGHRFLAVALAYTVSENHRGYWDSPLDDPDYGGPTPV